MNVLRVFIVAGHRFSIVMDEASPLWERLRVNYGPFEAAEVPEDAGEPIFTLNVSVLMITHRECALAYADEILRLD